MELKFTKETQDRIYKMKDARQAEDTEIHADMEKLKAEKAAVEAEMTEKTEKRDFDAYKDCKIQLEFIEDRLQMDQNRLDQIWAHPLCDEAENDRVVAAIKKEAVDFAGSKKVALIKHVHELAEIYRDLEKAKKLVNDVLAVWERDINHFGTIKKKNGKIPDVIMNYEYPNVDREYNDLIYLAEELPTSYRYEQVGGEVFKVNTYDPNFGYFRKKEPVKVTYLKPRFENNPVEFEEPAEDEE